MNINFHKDAVEFVRENNCACHTPVELIERAMIVGGIITAKHFNQRIFMAASDLDKKRKESRPHDHQSKPILIEL
jgi:hypothetical protein